MNRLKDIIARIQTYKNWPLLIFPLNRFGNDTFKTRAGPILKGNIFGADFVVVNEMFRRDDYQLKKIRLREHPIIFDVGANIGAFTLWASACFPEAKLYAFEPAGPVIKQLKDNLALNSVNVQFYPWALADENKTGELFIGKQNYEHTLHMARLGEHDWSGKTEQVICKTLPSIMGELHVDRIDLLKLDIEGEEYNVLINMPEDTYGKIENIVLEVHNSPRKQELLHLLARHFTEVRQSPTHPLVYWASKRKP